MSSDLTSASWNRTFELDGHRISYGFIYEGGEKFGDRYFVVVDDAVVNMNATEVLVNILLKVVPTLESGGETK